MKVIRTEGITYLSPVEGTAEWYAGNTFAPGDLYEAEELYRAGNMPEGTKLCLVHYPDGEVIWPVPEQAGVYVDCPVYLEGCLYFLQVDFPRESIRICCFDGRSREVTTTACLPLDSVKNCYNLRLHTSPLTLTRQGQEDLFEIIWPERVTFPMDPHESFFLRQDDRLFFNKWYEEGEGASYRYWEETVIRELAGKVAEVRKGDIRQMPNGELWQLG